MSRLEEIKKRMEKMDFEVWEVSATMDDEGRDCGVLLGFQPLNLEIGKTKTEALLAFLEDLPEDLEYLIECAERLEALEQ